MNKKTSYIFTIAWMLIISGCGNSDDWEQDFRERSAGLIRTEKSQIRSSDIIRNLGNGSRLTIHESKNKGIEFPSSLHQEPQLELLGSDIVDFMLELNNNISGRGVGSVKYNATHQINITNQKGSVVAHLRVRRDLDDLEKWSILTPTDGSYELKSFESVIDKFKNRDVNAK